MAYDVLDEARKKNLISDSESSTLQKKSFHGSKEEVEEARKELVELLEKLHPKTKQRIVKRYCKGGSTYAEGGSVDKELIYYKDADSRYKFQGHSGYLVVRAESEYGDGNKSKGYFFLDESTGYTETFDTEAEAKRGLKKYMNEMGVKVVTKKQFYEMVGWNIDDDYAHGGEVIGDNIDNAFLNASKKSELFLDVNYVDGKSKTIPIKTKTLKGIEQQAEDLFDLDNVDNIQLVRFWGDSKKVDIAVDLMAKGGKTRKNRKK